MILRAALVLLLAGAASAAEAGGYAFTAGATLRYLSEVKQTVAWSSAGEQLEYRTAITWNWLMKVVEAAPDHVVLRVTQLHVVAEHHGPGSDRFVDSARRDEGGDHDPLLGHLAAFDGAALTLHLDPATGTVSAVEGGEEWVKRLDARAPDAFGGGASPLHDQAVAAYSSEALARWWTQLLALPSAAPQVVPLAAPLDGSLNRRWSGDGWTLEAVPGAPVGATFGAGLGAIQASVHDLAGKGRAVRAEGMPALSEGEMTFVLDATALTQPVSQRHQLAWRLARVKAGDKPGDKPAD